jgi:predicted DNA-binding transcriptional regulator AlpA
VPLPGALKNYHSTEILKLLAQQMPGSHMRMTDELLPQVSRIFERAKDELLILLRAEQSASTSIAPSREWMSATQLAEYWQLYNDKNEPSSAGILKWAKRPADQFPLPHAYMGDLLRFNRSEVDQWARQEAERRRAQAEKRRLKIA